MRISASSDMYRHLDLAAACAELKKAGCAGVDLWASPFMCEHVTPQADASEIRSIVDSAGLEVAALTAYHTLSATRPIERFIRTVELASEVGAPCVVTNAVDWKGDLRSFLEHLRPALDVAREKGVKVAFENHSSQPFGATTEGLPAMASEVNDPYFGFTIAPPHLVIRGCDVAETIRQLKGRVFFFYAWDHVPGVDDNGKEFIWPPPDAEHHFPGQGKLDFASYLAALRDADYEHASGGWINIRAYPRYCDPPWQTERITTELRKAVEYVSDLLSRLEVQRRNG